MTTEQRLSLPLDNIIFVPCADWARSPYPGLSLISSGTSFIGFARDWSAKFSPKGPDRPGLTP